MTRPLHDFCWINIITPDAEREKAFFSAVLGWTYDEIPGMGWRILVNGKQMGGIFPNATPDGRTFPPQLGVMVRVADAAAAAERVRALGGRAEPPMAVGHNGIMVSTSDPGGASIDLWQAGNAGSAENDPMDTGSPIWYELLTRDVPQAVAYYTALFGWTAQAQPRPDFTYTVLQRDGVGIGGILPVLPHMPPMPPFWSTYMHVRDVDPAVAATLSAGGTVCMQPTDLPGVGRLAGIVSPSGVMCYVMAPIPPASAG